MPRPENSYWDRYQNTWLDRTTGQVLLADDPTEKDDGRLIQCPVCGKMVSWLRRSAHPCFVKAEKRAVDDFKEFVISMWVAMNGGARSWRQYGI